MNEMKLIMESWREYSSSQVTEQEINQLFECTIDEGALDLGKSLWNSTKQVLNKIKDWKEEKLTDLVKKMGIKLISLLDNRKKTNKLGKYDHRREVNAVKLLLSKKYINLGVMILTSIFRLMGGIALEKVIEVPEIIENISAILKEVSEGNFKKALSVLFGDLEEPIEMIKKFTNFRKDLKSLKYSIGGNKGEFELAEILYIFGEIK